MSRHDLNRSEDVLNRVSQKDNVAVIILLESKESGQKILVANCHLHWDPNYADVKIIQTALLMDEIETCITKWKKHNIINLSTIICGDFNSLPDSGPVELLSTGTLSGTHDELSSYKYGHLTEKGIKHNLKLKSAYSFCEDIDFTNFTPLFRGTIDYIWYDTANLVMTGLLGGVDKQYVKKTVGFPNPHHPSDHIPLVVSMRIKNNTSLNRKGNLK
jgi:CCR4-NOT transcription complex subunit 6